MTTLDSRDFESVLKFIMDRWGAEVFLKSERVAGLLSDLAPELRRERDMVVRLSKNGILPDFIKNSHADEATKKRLIAKFANILIESEYVREEVAVEYLKMMASVFDWEIEFSVKNTIADKSVSMPQIELANGDDSPLLRRAFIFLEDGDYSNAKEYFERTLDHDPENARAYLGKLMVEMQIPRQSDLKNCKYPFSSNKNYQKALRYGGKELSEFLQKTNDFIQRRNENERLLALYKEAESAKHRAFDEKTFKAAGRKYQAIEGYKDAKEQAKECFLKAKAYREYERERQKKQKYEAAKKTMNKACDEETFKNAGELFRKVQGYRDADSRAKECFQKAQECAVKESQQQLQITYDNAMQAMNKACDEETFKNAGELFRKVQGYSDADKLAKQCFDKAELYRREDLLSAKKENEKNKQKYQIQSAKYISALENMRRAKNEASYLSVAKEFQEISGFKDAGKLAQECYEKAEHCRRNRKRVLIPIFGILFAIAAIVVTIVMNSLAKERRTESEGPAPKKVKGEKINLTVWSPMEDQAGNNWLGKVCDRFNEEHPEWDITYKYGVVYEGDAWKYITDNPEDGADVYMFTNDQIPNLVKAGGLAEISGKNLETVKKINSETIVSTVTYRGKVYGVPFTGNTWFMYYNKDIFSEEDVKNLDTMLNKGKISFPLNNAWYFASFYAANGCTLFGRTGDDESAGIQMGGQSGSEVTKYLVNLVANKNFVNDSNGSGLSDYGDGAIGAFFSGSWDYNNALDALGNDDSKLGICAAPTITIGGKKRQMKAFAGSKAIGVNSCTCILRHRADTGAFASGHSAAATDSSLIDHFPFNHNDVMFCHSLKQRVG